MLADGVGDALRLKWIHQHLKPYTQHSKMLIILKNAEK